MEQLLVIAPILLPLLSAIVVTIFWFNRRIQSTLNLVGSTGLFIIGIILFNEVWANGTQAVQVGQWPAPFGITIVADMFSAVMILLTGLVAFVMAIYSTVVIDRRRKQFGYYSLINTLYMGVCGAFLTGDLFNLFVWFEVILISSFVLLTLGGETRQLEGTFKYVTINLIASALFLVGVGFLYGIAGTLNMADLSVKLSQHPNQGLITVIAMFFLVAFGIKAAVFPMFFWLPASYHTPPIAITAIFAALLSKVGVYSLIRTFTLLFVGNIGYTHTILLIIAGLTMVVGVLGAAAQFDMRRLLSMHIISQIGYMVMGLAINTQLGLAAAILHMGHNMIVKTNLLLVSGCINRLQGSFDIRTLGGIRNTYPVLSFIFIVSALSLSGIPPLSGFWSKFLLIKAGFEAGQYLIIAISLIVSLVTLFSMTKIWNYVFWQDSPKSDYKSVLAPDKKIFTLENILMYLPMLIFTLSAILIGLFPGYFFEVVNRAASELLNPENYINTVLGGLQ